jgi:hypothetical protein
MIGVEVAGVQELQNMRVTLFQRDSEERAIVSGNCSNE